MPRWSGYWVVVVFALLGAVQRMAVAEDVYVVKPLRELKITERKLPANPDTWNFSRGWRRVQAMQPYAVLEGEGEIYLALVSGWMGRPLDNSREAAEQARIAVRVSQPREIRGHLFLPRPDNEGMVKLPFVVPAGEPRASQSKEFLRVKKAHYQRLLDINIAGAAWFRHQVRDAAEALGEKWDEESDRRRRFFLTTQATDLESTYALASGGRAVSENLQLDRFLPESEPDEATVPLDSIEGITIREFDWARLTENIDPQPDPLAALIPDDQHALFFSSFAALVSLADAAQEQGTPVLRAAETRAEDALSRERYQRQLCLPLGQAERLFGPQLIASAAITGGDPYFRTGTDVAVLFEAKNPQLLRQTLDARVALSRKEHADVEAVEGEVRGVAYTGARSPDREICCYLASLDQVVVVANSLQQLERIVAVHQGDEPALASLPEYAFFRHRYPRNDSEETAFLVLSDKTIRRWCGPRWRIAASRRTRAAAVMAEVQATHLNRLVRNDIPQAEIQAAFWVPEADRFTLNSEGVSSSVYGNLDFQTPIGELDLAYVTQAEAELYRRWREGYQRNWRNFFDPIAVRFSVAPDKHAVDLTVMPLIANTDYRQWVGLSQGAALGPTQGDPHPEAVLHWALALNPESETLRSFATLARAFIRVNLLDWIGPAAAVYADADPYWKEWAAAQDREDFIEKNFHRLPVAVHVETRSGLKLAAFLTGLRGFVEQAAPGMTEWETKTHNDEPYVKITPSARGRAEVGEEFDRLAIYYAASGQGLTATFNEIVLQRALDRQKAQREAGDQKKPPAGAAPWIGDNLCLRVDGAALPLLHAGLGEAYQDAMQARSWGNLPILNEWKRRFPEHDPLALHQRFWGVRLVCPGGGEYVWNEDWQTYASTVYGHPGEPQEGPKLPAVLKNVSNADFGLTFEENGLRGRVELRLGAPSAE